MTANIFVNDSFAKIAYMFKTYDTEDITVTFAFLKYF